MINIESEIAKLKQSGTFKERTLQPLSFGTYDECKSLIKDIFIAVDKTINKFQFLPEYDKVAKYLSNTEGKGLHLHGDCGRGKTLILTYVMPILFKSINKHISSFNSLELHKNIESLESCKNITVEDVGLETISKTYGNELDIFSYLCEKYENNNGLLLFSTNLNLKAIHLRYGDRTIDRISKLCYSIEFKGKSLR
ncbi:MAG: hypothetical protein WCT77_06020 [Bacteroidota bacterium]